MDYEKDGFAYNLLSDVGFLYAIRQVLRVKEDGLSFWGLPCDSFGFMSSPGHQRTWRNPFGCGYHKFVVAGNILATRMVCLLCLSVVRRLRFFVEQPDRSMAMIFPYLQHLLSFPHVQVQRVTWLGAQLIFGVPQCNTAVDQT